jgi:hypothetical protein
VRQKDLALARALDAGLRAFESHVRRLPGIAADTNREALIRTLIESVRRVRFAVELRNQAHSPLRADPRSELFDPLKAAVIRIEHGDIEEAFWLVFLSVHFGKHLHDGWRLARDIYGRLGSDEWWTWDTVSRDPAGFSDWLDHHERILSGADGVRRRFGNHRKYESLKRTAPRGTGKVVESYVRWVSPPATHQMVIAHALRACGGEPRQTFDYLFRSMRSVIGFGRTGRFDYLTMVGKLGLAAIEPGSTYMDGATGPYTGAKLLFGMNREKQFTRKEADAFLVELDNYLHVGMQVLEDALCNWQKNPSAFRPFRG